MRLIDADDRKLRTDLTYYTCWTGIDEAPYLFAVDMLDKATTIDAVPVIRCKDCKRWTKPHGWNGWCEHGIPVDEDDYCSHAERKEG